MAASWAVKYICRAKQACTEFTGSSTWLTSAKYYIKDNYKLMRGSRDKIRWNMFVWNRFSMPKHRIICWLALQDRLKTKARLFPLGIGVDNLCGLCGSHPEIGAHLFFECKYSIDCCTAIMHWLGFRTYRSSLISLFQWVRRYCTSGFKRKVTYAVITGVVYFIWKARNSSIWKGSVPTVKHTVQHIQFCVKNRVSKLIGKKISTSEAHWFASL
ncbi:uncharacterized protein [Spinacia oleracea]|uniref:Reverse transcriptase zinc-binding domain-containing protein n=1 Tax=Spinacia oleracea TaxID=3562 RepID=A0A9R0J4U7_SPIOL|nr:uncharacterized protein LOC110800258 [Spinacia oleracea]